MDSRIPIAFICALAAATGLAFLGAWIGEGVGVRMAATLLQLAGILTVIYRVHVRFKHLATARFPVQKDGAFSWNVAGSAPTNKSNANSVDARFDALESRLSSFETRMQRELEGLRSSVNSIVDGQSQTRIREHEISSALAGREMISEAIAVAALLVGVVIGAWPDCVAALVK